MKTTHLNRRWFQRSITKSRSSGSARRRDAIASAFEPLEQRRMLAVVTVGNNLDVVNGNTSSIANLIANPGGDGISLREAILAANNTAGADTINFAPALAGQTITLNGTALPQITDHLTINGATNLSVQPVLTHVVDVAPSVIAQVNNLTLFGGFRAGNGGAIANSGLLVLTNVTVRNSFTVSAHGGGIYNHSGAELQLHHSSVTSNIAQFGHGGGVYNLGELVVTHSTISGNSASGGQGGGIHNTGRAIVLDSTIADNQAVGTTTAAQGGGVYNNSPLHGISLQRVTLQGNQAIGGNGANGANGSNGSPGTLILTFYTSILRRPMALRAVQAAMDRQPKAEVFSPSLVTCPSPIPPLIRTLRKVAPAGWAGRAAPAAPADHKRHPFWAELPTQAAGVRSGVRGTTEEQAAGRTAAGCMS